MPRRAVISDTSKGHLTKAERAARNKAEEMWRNGTLDDYDPAGLDEYGRIAFDRIVRAIPEDKLAEVDGYTIETCANALAMMRQCDEIIKDTGIIVERDTRNGNIAKANEAIAVYARYAEIARKFFIELGCTPSARAKIASDFAAAVAKPKSARAALSDD